MKIAYYIWVGGGTSFRTSSGENFWGISMKREREKARQPEKITHPLPPPKIIFLFHQIAPGLWPYQSKLFAPAV